MNGARSDPAPRRADFELRVLGWRRQVWACQRCHRVFAVRQRWYTPPWRWWREAARTHWLCPADLERAFAALREMFPADG